MFSVVITIIGTCLYMYLEFDQELKSIHNTFKQVESSYQRSITNSLWITDYELLQIELEGILKLPYMQFIEVRKGAEVLKKVGTPQSENIIEHTIPLIYVYNGRDVHLGELHVVASLKGIYAGIYDHVMVILCIQVITIFSLSLFIFIIFYKLVGKHIVYMASFVESIHFESMNQPLLLHRKVKLNKPDELELLVTSFNLMRKNLTQYLLQQEIAKKEILEININLELTTNLLQNILNSVPVRVFWKDSNLRFMGCNTLLAEDAGLSNPEELIGKNDYEMTWKDQADLYREDDMSVIKSGTSKLNFEEPQTTPDGSKIWLRTSKVPLHDQNHKIIGVLGIYDDITEYKKYEKLSLQVLKMESISTLAGGIAHDFNNILMGIIGNISLAKLKISKDHPGFKYLEESEKTVDRATHLTSRLLTFAKGGEPVIDNISVGKLAEQVARFDLTGSNVKLIFKKSEDLWPGKVDKGQIQQVLSNLTINARQAMPDGGILYITLENTDIPENTFPDLNQGKYIKLTVRDQGAGIDPKHIKQIFDPFFTTKQTGTGLGLATTYSILKKHGGKINIDSELGKGTTFTLYLPASETELDLKTNQSEPAENSTIKQTAKILVMDDEEMICRLLTDILEEDGFKVSTALEGKQAIEIYQHSLDEGAPFDAVIMDLTIPGGIGGKEAVINFLKIDPKAKCIVSSGYADDHIMANFGKYGFKGIIIKPYTSKTLLEVLSQVLKE